jgi:hypothetical protein
MNADGKIITVNYRSKSELSLAEKLTWMDKPSLIMNNGMLEFSGKNASYTFHAGSLTYLVEDIRISSEDGLFGVFMKISKKPVKHPLFPPSSFAL